MTKPLFQLPLSGVTLLLSIIGILVSSWFLVHVLSVFGIFLATAYPLWWLFAPERTVCFLCRSQPNGYFCSFCKEDIHKEQGVSPKTVTSAVYNGGLIFILSLLSLGLVIGESKLLKRFGFPASPKTASFHIAPKGQYRVEEIFPMKIEITGIETPINAVQADLSFDPTKLEVVDVSTQDSFAEIFIQKEMNQETGHIRLTGGLANPGFTGKQGLFGTVFFKAKSPGVVKIEFLPSSLALANDGQGTNVLKDLASVSYLIRPEKLSSAEIEIQNQLFASPAATTSSQVLGETTTQMKFYDEGEVLGINSQSLVVEPSPTNLDAILHHLGKIDDFILGITINNLIN